MIKRIGFACKWLNDPSECGGMKVNAVDRDLNGRSTTMRWLREHPEQAEQRQWDIMNHNTAAAVRMIERVATLPPERRMVRLGSEMLQGYTEKDWQAWWQQADVQRHLERIFAPIGETARRLDVRISFHPGQFCVLASENDNIVNRSIEEFEYHADMARWMGYGVTFQSWERLCEAIDSLELVNDVALVLDLHHHWIRTGEYISSQDDRIKRVIDSWRGVRPVVHYSTSREDVVVGHTDTVKPDLDALLAAGYKKQKLRAHSDFAWNQETNAWALTHWCWADIMVEAKGKNLASQQLYEQSLAQTVIEKDHTNLLLA